MVRVSAPGSLMIAGEYAVLMGKQALAMAINQRLTVTLSQENHANIRIDSNLGQREINLPISSSDDWVTHTLKAYETHLIPGLTVTITSDINPNQGLGSSAALLTALVAALECYVTQAPLSQNALWQRCYHILTHHQALASGTDLAASIFGGVIHFNPTQQKVTSVPTDCRWMVVYTGYKTKTPDAIIRIRPQQEDIIWDHIDQHTTLLHRHLIANDDTAIGRELTALYEAQKTLGCCCEQTQKVYRSMQGYCHGVKISGSGLGDCLIGVCKDNAKDYIAPNGAIPLQVSPTDLGVIYHD